MKAAVLCPSGDPLLAQAAGQVRAGAAEAGLEAALLYSDSKPDFSEFDSVFVGISAYGLSKRMEALSLAVSSQSASLPRRREYRVFCVHSGGGKKALEEARGVLEGKGHSLSAGVLLECRGLLKHFGRGSLSEGELARAKAFGERGAYALLGSRAARPANEKTKIPGYRK